jgi:hypothetical protein
MLGSLVAAAVEVSILNLEAGNAILVQLQKMFKGRAANQSEAESMQDRFVMLQQAFADVLSNPPPAADLLSMIRANYERRLAEEFAEGNPRRVEPANAIIME